MKNIFNRKRLLLYDNEPIVFSEAFLKSRTKHKIWKEGYMLKYKSWK